MQAQYGDWNSFNSCRIESLKENILIPDMFKLTFHHNFLFKGPRTLPLHGLYSIGYTWATGQEDRFVLKYICFWITQSESLLKELKKKILKKPQFQSKKLNVYLTVSFGDRTGFKSFPFENFLMILTCLNHEKILLEMAKKWRYNLK